MDVQNKNKQFNYTQYFMLQVCTDYATSPTNILITNQVPDFKLAIEGILSKTGSINMLLAQQQENTKGTTNQKRTLKRNLAKAMFAVSDPVAGYAAKIGNQDLYDSIAKAMSSYIRMRPNNLTSQAEAISEIVTPLLPQLVGTGVNAQALTDIADAKELFATYISKPRNKIIAKYQDLNLMNRFLKEAMDIMRTQADRFAGRFIGINQENFYNGWERARKLTPYGTLHTRASVDVVLGDLPVKNAIVSIDFTKLKNTTDNAGHTTISHVPYGDQSITVIAPGYPNPVHAGPFKFKKGQATHITINVAELSVPQPVNNIVTANS